MNKLRRILKTSVGSFWIYLVIAILGYVLFPSYRGKIVLVAYLITGCIYADLKSEGNRGIFLITFLTWPIGFFMDLSKEGMEWLDDEDNDTTT